MFLVVIWIVRTNVFVVDGCSTYLDELIARSFKEMSVWAVPLKGHYAFFLVDMGLLFFDLQVQLFDSVPCQFNTLDAHRGELVFSEALVILGDCLYGDCRPFLRAWIEPVKWEARPVKNSCGHSAMIGLDRVAQLIVAAREANHRVMRQPVTMMQYQALREELELFARSAVIAQSASNK